MSKTLRFGFFVSILILVSVVNAVEPDIGTQKFQIRSESKSFEKIKYKNLNDVKAAVAKYRKSFNSRMRDLDKRCSNHFGEGYHFNGLSIKERAIGYINEELPIEKFNWKRLVAEVYIQCIKS